MRTLRWRHLIWASAHNCRIKRAFNTNFNYLKLFTRKTNLVPGQNENAITSLDDRIKHCIKMHEIFFANIITGCQVNYIVLM